MILYENLFQDYRKPLKESAEAVKRILQPRVTKYGIKPFGNNERLPKGFRFKSSSGTNGEVTYNGRDYVYAIKNGEVRVMDSSKAGHNWSETIYKESVNESKSINEDIDSTLNKLGGPETFRSELMATIEAYPGIEDDIEELADMMYGSYKGVISIEELESAIEYMIDDALESTEAVNSSYSPELLDDLVNFYSSFDTMSSEEIWDEIVAEYNNEDLANDVIESLDNDEEDSEDEFLGESKSINEVNEGIDGWDNRTGVIKRIDKYLSDNPEATPPKGYIQKGSRAYDDAVSRYGNYVTTPFGNISTDDLMQYARENKLLAEASYGMAKEKFKNKYLNESISLSEDQLDKAMELVDEIYEACKSIYSYNENGKFEEGLNLNEWSIYAAAADLHDIVERGSLTESADQLDNTADDDFGPASGFEAYF